MDLPKSLEDLFKDIPVSMPHITAKVLTGRLPATSGPCPECGRPALYSHTPDLSVQHHDPAEHAACPMVVMRERAQRMIVEGAKSIYMADLLDEPAGYGRLVDRAIGDLAARQQDAIEAELMTVPPGHRLCMHDDVSALCEPPATFDASDTYTLRVRQRGHVLAPGETCRHHGTRTEYGWPVGTVVARLGPCGRPDDCRLIEAADGTRYWFRSHGCPVQALPAPPWTELDEWYADAWRRELGLVDESYDPAALAEEFDAMLCGLLTSEPVEAEADDRPLIDKLREMFERVSQAPYRQDPPPVLTQGSAEILLDISRGLAVRRLDELIKGYSTGVFGRPGDVFLEVGPDAWTSLRARTPQVEQIAGGSVPIYDLTGIRIVTHPDHGDRWRLLSTTTGEVIAEGVEPSINRIGGYPSGGLAYDEPPRGFPWPPSFPTVIDPDPGPHLGNLDG